MASRETHRGRYRTDWRSIRTEPEESQENVAMRTASPLQSWSILEYWQARQ